MTEEWGPWIEHGGSGCPMPMGTVFHVVDDIDGGQRQDENAGGHSDPGRQAPSDGYGSGGDIDDSDIPF